jgi:hypothetical protein
MIFSGSAVLLLLSGCSLMQKPEYSVPSLYDLASQKAAPLVSAPAEFRSFADVTGNGTGIVYRAGGGEVTSDDLNRFTAPPVQLIRRRLIELFPPAAQSPLKVSGILSRFEIDRRSKSAVMALDYQLLCHGRSKALRHRISVPLKGESGVLCAEALESCVISSARRLAGEISIFAKECERKRVEK